MVEPAATADGPDVIGAPPSTAGPRRPRRPRWRTLVAGAVLVIGGVLAIGLWQGGRSPSPSPSAAPGAGRSGSDPVVALIDAAGALATVDSAGTETVLAAEPNTAYGFPAWSPDGSRLAAVVARSDGTSIAVFAARPAESRPSPAPPVVVYRSADIPAFYLYWTPDGQRISFLATEADGISLRVAPADGSGPLEGGPGTVIRQGAPLYFDWLDAERVLLHVGTGPGAFLGEVGLDGASAAPALDGTGDFRPAVAGGDGRFVAFVRGLAPSAELVVARRDGSAEHATAVSGPAAIVFDPGGRTVGSIAAVGPGSSDIAFPLGPLRLIDGDSGTIRTLLDGNVVAFFWSPDGRTIAALRLQAGSGSTVADGTIVAAAAISGAAAPTPAPTPGPELHLVFVDVRDGKIRSDRVVQLTNAFVRQFLPYFDQYALSHRLWSPDSSSILLPLIGETGRSQLVAVRADGATPRTFDASSGFWSP